MPDLFIRNARIWTGADPTWADTAYVRDGRFLFVGRAGDVSPQAGAPILDLEGRFMMPGFIDAHVHLLGTGLAMSSVDLKGVASAEEALRRVADRVAVTPADSWVTGAGWDQNLWAGAAFPHRHMLDRVSGVTPIVLTHTSGHCIWTNSAALRAAGVTGATPDPAGGAIDRDGEGAPTGILRDQASKLVADAMPHVSQADRIAAVEAAVRHAHRLGVTGVHAMNAGRGEFQALHALNDAARLRLRVRLYLAHDRLDEWIERNLATGDGDDMLRIGGVKFFADGALGSLTAWMFEPYERAVTSGFPLQPVEDLERDVRRSLEQGLAPAIHAIGDRANHEVLDLYQRVTGVGTHLPRRIEHAQCLIADDIGRFAAQQIFASMQPVHAPADWRKVDAEWGARGRGAYAFASLLSSGARLAFGSDTPVETMDPLAGVHAAVTRRTADGKPATGWFPDERIPVAEALHSYTVGAAAAGGEADSTGVIREGARADAVVLSADPFSLADHMALQDISVVMTIVAGEIVHDGKL
jgi:predicted amidohydrolase YtcJ